MQPENPATPCRRIGLFLYNIVNLGYNHTAFLSVQLWRYGKIEFEAVLFDLDGTLLDTLTDLADSFNAALRQLGFPTHPTDSYRHFTGQGINGLAQNALPQSHRNEQTVNKVLALARQQYSKHWSLHTRAYPGIPELLTRLEQLNLPKVVLSNKPDDFTQIITKKLLSSWTFSIVQGEKPPIPKKPDPTAALEIADRLKIPPDKFLYIGDTDTDMWTAKAAGMYPVGVLWGFRPEELLEAGAKSLIKNPMELLKLLDSKQ